jgi:hypothetical protein
MGPALEEKPVLARLATSEPSEMNSPNVVSVDVV